MPKLPSEQHSESKSPDEDTPVKNGTMTAVGPDDPDAIRARRRKLSDDAEDGNVEAMTETLAVALRLSAEVEMNAESSLYHIALASLINPIKYLLGNRKAMLAAFNVTRSSNRPASGRSAKRQIKMAEEIGQNLANGYVLSEAKKRAAEVHSVTVRTAQRAYKRYRLEVDVAEILERKFRGKK